MLKTTIPRAVGLAALMALTGCDDAGYSAASASNEAFDSGSVPTPGADVGTPDAPADAEPTPDAVGEDAEVDVPEAPAPLFTSITAGRGGFCALADDGRAHCFGSGVDRYRRALGDGRYKKLDLGPPIVWGTYGFADTICAIDLEDQLRCWALAYDEISRATEFEAALAGKQIEDVTSTLFRACAAVKGEGVYCWVPPVTYRDPPDVTGVYRIAGTESVRSMRGDIGMVIALDDQGAVTWWNREHDRAQPVTPPGVRFRAVDRLSGHFGDGFPVCGVTVAGRLACYGLDHVNGDYDTFGRPETPADVELVSISIGSHNVYLEHPHSCALDTEGRAWCWGSHAAGQLGVGIADPDVQIDPAVWMRPVATDRKFVQLAVQPLRDGDTDVSKTCGVTDEGALLCWGRQRVGEASWSDPSRGLHDPDAAPVQGVPPLRQLRLGETFGCALDRAGATWCWGDNRRGQVSPDPTDQVVGTPVRREDLPRFDRLSGDGATTCGQTGEGEWLCWGALVHEREEDVFALTRESGRELTQVEMSGKYLCGLDTQGVAYCADLDPRHTPPAFRPVPVPFALRSFTLAGPDTACGIDLEGGAHCWGKYIGQLGPASIFGAESRQRVDLGEMSANALHALRGAGPGPMCATDGATLRCWLIAPGVQGDVVPSHPVAIPTGLLASPHALTFTPGGLCGRDSLGERHCSGDFWSAESGSTLRLEPDPDGVHPGAGGEFFESDGYICALNEGTVRCAGDDDYGQLGRGTSVIHPRPVLVRP